jgi:hypothetical protein
MVHNHPPGAETPRYAAWKSQLEESLALLNDKSILVGHSLGGSVLLKYLSEETRQKSISGLFIVAAPCWGADQEWQSDEILLSEKTFLISSAYRGSFFIIVGTMKWCRLHTLRSSNKSLRRPSSARSMGAVMNSTTKSSVKLLTI